MARIAAHLPHPGVGLAPAPCRGVGEVGDERLDLGMELAELFPVQVQGVQELPVDVELYLVPGAVSEAHRARIAPAAQMREVPFREVVLAPNPVHDLQRSLARPATGRAGHKGDEIVRFVRAGSDVERLQRQARVPDPGEAVVPVALAAERFGQRGCGRGDYRAGGAIGESLQHPGARAYELLVRSLVDIVLGLPGAPRLDCVVDPRGDSLGISWLWWLRMVDGRPVNSEPLGLTLADRERGMHGGLVDLDRNGRASGDAIRSTEGPPATFLLAEERLDQPVFALGG